MSRKVTPERSTVRSLPPSRASTSSTTRVNSSTDPSASRPSSVTTLPRSSEIELVTLNTSTPASGAARRSARPACGRCRATRVPARCRGSLARSGLRTRRAPAHRYPALRTTRIGQGVCGRRWNALRPGAKRHRPGTSAAAPTKYGRLRNVVGVALTRPEQREMSKRRLSRPRPVTQVGAAAPAVSAGWPRELAGRGEAAPRATTPEKGSLAGGRARWHR